MIVHLSIKKLFRTYLASSGDEKALSILEKKTSIKDNADIRVSIAFEDCKMDDSLTTIVFRMNYYDAKEQLPILISKLK